MRIISFGEIVWDVYPSEATLGGAPFNFAAHASLWGADVALISAVGNDELGRRALAETEKLGIIRDFISVSDKARSGECKVTLDKNMLPKFDLAEDSAYDCVELPVLPVGECDVLAFGTLALRYENNRSVLKRIISECAPKEIFADLNIRPPFYSKESVEFCLSYASIVKISDEDMKYVSELLFEGDCSERDFAQALARAYPQIKLILLTKGEHGSVCYACRENTAFICPAKKTDAVSTVGAGDSYGAAFAVNYVKTGDIARSMELASRASAFVVSHREAVPRKTEDFINSITK